MFHGRENESWINYEWLVMSHVWFMDSERDNLKKFEKHFDLNWIIVWWSLLFTWSFENDTAYFKMMHLRFQIFLRKVIIVAAALIALAAFAHAIPTPGPIASGAITIYPIPQRPPYAPNPWVYPKPTTVQPAGR